MTATNRASSRVALYANGQAVGVTRSSNYASSERSYFGTDLMGTVRSATTDSGSAEYYEYDVFGKPYGESVSDYAYTGKPYDPVTGMYNYGYRDYVPQTARFSTIDPIRDGSNWFAYCDNEPVNFLDAWGLFYYGPDGQKSTNEWRQTTVYIIRDDDGTGNEFNATRYIQKTDAYGNTETVYQDVVGANCRDIYNGSEGSTTPDGTYYLTNNGTKPAPLYPQTDGTTDSTKFDNVVALKTVDTNIEESVRNDINNGDRLFHADQYKGSSVPYNSTRTLGGAGCIVSQGQNNQNEMMDALMKDVENVESIIVKIVSLNNQNKEIDCRNRSK